MRLFVALEIPENVRENLAAVLRELRSKDASPRWVRPENLHMTLKFIGESAPEKLAGILSALSGVRSDSAVNLDFRGLGFFPGEKHPRVLWVGMEASANLKMLASDIDSALEPTGVARETRPFSPHLTLARCNDGRLSDKLRGAIRERMDQLAEKGFGGMRTDEFHLIESKLQRSGAEYTRLAAYKFFRQEG